MECLKCLTKEDLRQIHREFEHHRQNCLRIYVACLEVQFSNDHPEETLAVLKEEKGEIWKSFLHYNEMAKWVEGELGRRK